MNTDYLDDSSLSLKEFDARLALENDLAALSTYL
jgi:hypothetical protein